MSGQKYRRTNFEDEDDNQCISPADGLNGDMAVGDRGLATPSSGSFDPWSNSGTRERVDTQLSLNYEPSMVSFKTASGVCYRRSQLERILLVLVAVLTVVALILAIALASHRHPDAVSPPSYGGGNGTERDRPKNIQGLCTSKVCVTAASTILNSIDESVNPCDDFYSFACGGWIKSHPIPAGESKWDAFGVLRQANEIVLHNLLEKPVDANVTGSTSELNARLFYRSCMDVNKVIDGLGAEPLLSMIRKEIGVWPLISNSNDESFLKVLGFQASLEKIHSMFVSFFFSFFVDMDEKDPDTNILKIDQPLLTLNREQYLNRTITEDYILSAYLTLMIDIVSLLGAKDLNTTRDQMIAVLELEQDIANITTPVQERRDDEQMYHKKTLKEVQKIAPFINWTHYATVRFSVADKVINESEPVLVIEPVYMSQLSSLIAEKLKSKEGLKVIENFLMWQLVRSMSSWLSKPFQEANKKFSRTTSGISGDREQWRYCTSETDQSPIHGMPLSAMFIRQTFHGESKVSADQMVQMIKEAFIANLPNLSWMDEYTRKAATEKAQAVVDMIGYPDYILNSTYLDNKYKDLVVKEDEYFMNNYRSIYVIAKKEFGKLRQLPNKLEWFMTPATINAYYQPTTNLMVFPAGILQSPFYNKDFPRSLNFGAIGVVVGHELTHGFDDQGREYDKDGYLRSWWNESSIDRFRNQTQCMVDEYSHFTAYGEHLKGKQTLGENIADNGGLKASFVAYENWVQANGREEPLLPGLNFTHRQLFFLAFSQVWCTTSRPEDTHNAILSDPHSLPHYRVVGPLSNSVKFSEHFNCPLGSPMNPPNKCVIW